MEPSTTRIPGGPAVRPLRPEDEPAVSRLLTDCGDYFVAATGSTALPADVQSLYYSLPDGADFAGKHLLVLEHEDRPVGLVDAVEGHPEPATCSVGLFLVGPHARGTGLGLRAARYLLREAAGRGTRRVTATCPEGWTTGIAFLRRLDFDVRPPAPEPSATVGNRLRRPQERRLCTAVRTLTEEDADGAAAAPGRAWGGTP
ncbi:MULTISPECIES: GNAT family N-acetyltransferase [Streptomyces]|uniref:GNAT family N-acetyltransferase n=1 Tax=Streptomyces TaxID=1883 RepID=UPI0029B1BA52|nr:GNAT family N-acetyltransferase [Streptomyces sp. WI03-4A]MDX2591522.1 GNAT family N-acetyltransferase [Streptomyces sp. WI03-4A]